MKFKLNKSHLILANLMVMFFALFIAVTPLVGMAAGPVTGGIIPCGGSGQHECTFDDLVKLGQNIIDFLIYNLSPVVATVLFVWAGYLYMYKGATGGSVDEAKGMLWNTVIGFMIALGAFLIIKLVIIGFGVDQNSGFNRFVSF